VERRERSVLRIRVPGLQAAAALLSCVAFALWGCSNPTGSDDDDDDLYPLRSSPDSLLAKFVKAYENMDVEAYLDCLADSMLFYLCEEDVASNPELEPGYWTKAVEDSIHHGMFGGGAWGADSIALELTTTDIETLRIAGDRARLVGWRYEEDVDLRVWIGDTWRYWARNPSSFVISVDPDETGPHGEPLYEIGEWRDLEPWWRAGTAREWTSWGLIKTLYL
jgi:hypothetical protein